MEKTKPNKKEVAISYLKDIGLIDTEQFIGIVGILQGKKIVVYNPVSTKNIDEKESVKEINPLCRKKK